MKPKHRSLNKVITSSLPAGHFNLTAAQIEKLRNVGEVILATGAVLGLVLVTVVAPNALQLLGKAKSVKKTYKNLLSKDREERQKIARTFYYLKREGLIKLIPKGKNFLMKITEKGRHRLEEMSLRSLKIPASPKWDGSWWIAIADIPTELRSQANLFRNKLKELNVYTLQRSVWVYPFNPRKELAFISGLYGLDKYLTVFKATDLEAEDEANLKSYYAHLIKAKH